ncbi:MAG: hypothetical protein VX519_06970 [Myxococcota bacterium]|nr:hypothetical protein [Myxococcota bacterium]
MNPRYLSLIPILLLAGCFGKGKAKTFSMTSNEALTKVARDLEFGDEIGGWLSEVARACDANAPACPSMIIADMEKRSYQDDNKPDHLLHDALIERLTSDEFGVTVLERDPDVIDMLEVERNGVKLPASMEPIDTTVGDDMTPDERRQQAASLIAEITSVLAAQDVLLFDEEECCDGDGVASGGPPNPTAIIANEVGATKAQLIRDLVSQYLSLFPKGVPQEIPQRVVDVDISDFLFAYRIYEYDNDLSTDALSTDRTTSLQIHVRIVDLVSGEIIVSDFLANEFTETLKLIEKREKKEKEKKEKKFYDPYTSIGGALTQYSLNADVLPNDDGNNRAASSAIGVLAQYNHWTKRAYRFTARLGGGAGSGAYTADPGDVQQGVSTAFGAAFTFDKVFMYNRPLQVLAGVGLDFGMASAKTVSTGDNDNNIAAQIDRTSGWAAAPFVDAGFVYNINRLGLEVGYHQPLTVLAEAGNYTNDIGGSSESNETRGTPYSAPMFRLGLNIAYCSVLQLPGAPGNTCTRDSADND